MEYPKFDATGIQYNIEKTDDRDYIDLSFAEGALLDGRPYRAEVWAGYQMTFITVSVSMIGIESITAEEMKQLLILNNLIVFDDDKFEESYHSRLNCNVRPTIDKSGNSFWAATIIVGDEDGTFVRERTRFDPTIGKR